MSRTAHHLSHGRVPSPWTHPIVSVTTLRYASAALTAAEEHGHRPEPDQIRHRVRVYPCARVSMPGDYAAIARRHERRARRRLRDDLAAARAVLRADPAADVDFMPARHRHAAAWEAI